MIKKLFEKNETFACIALIVIYVVVNSACLQNFDTTDIRCALVNLVFSAALLGIAVNLKRTEYYGLKKADKPGRYLFYIPLAVIASVNLWGGIRIANTPAEILFHFITMLNVGFIEEIIFRGFLYRMMEKSNPKAAAIVCAVTFGIGHIVNLLNGADFIPTLLQICYAVAIGWLFVVIFRKSRSLVPCIITHGVLNSLSIFSTESSALIYGGSAALIIISLAYAFYIDRKVKD